jgi:ubiquinol-cytochrome c reductase cytochrome b subunit
MGVLFLMPIVGRWKAGHQFNRALICALLLVIGALTAMAMVQDRGKPDYKLAVIEADRNSHRVIELAQGQGIGNTAAVGLLRTDPFTQGPRLFKRNCASCHRYDGHDGLGGKPDEKTSPQTASELKGFASRAWLGGLLDPAKIDTVHYFGGTKLKNGDMVDFVKNTVADLEGEKKANIPKILAALSAEAGLKSQKALDAGETATIDEGRKLIRAKANKCINCHKFHEAGADNEDAPDLTGYGSRQWMIDFVSNPAHERFYGDTNDRMPAFGVKKQLTPEQIGYLVDWLRGEWYEAGGGASPK